MRKIIIPGALALLAITLWARPAQAQEPPDLSERKETRFYGAVTYNMALPFMATKDFTDSFSPQGVGLELRAKPLTFLSLGLSVAWQAFNKKSSEVITQGDIAAQGTQLRYINTVPILATIHFYLTAFPRGIRPFAGVGVGTYFMEQRLDLSVFSTHKNTWHFGLGPEVGVAVPLGSIFGLFIVRYNHAFSSGGSGDQSWLNFNIGMGWQG